MAPSCLLEQESSGILTLARFLVASQTALAAEGWAQLADALAATAARTGDFAELGVSYVLFATDHPGHFAIMRHAELVHGDDPDLTAARGRAGELLRHGAPDADAPAEPAQVLAGWASMAWSAAWRNPLGDCLGGRRVNAHEQHSELLATDPGQDVRVTQDRTHACDEVLERRIAGGVPAKIVHELEVVQVKNQHRDSGGVRGDPCLSVGERRTAAETAGQRIGCGIQTQLGG
jgi:hypothetical protein